MVRPEQLGQPKLLGWCKGPQNARKPMRSRAGQAHVIPGEIAPPFGNAILFFPRGKIAILVISNTKKDLSWDAGIVLTFVYSWPGDTTALTIFPRGKKRIANEE